MIEDFIDTHGNKQVRTRNSPLGGTMRLGEYECYLKKDSKLAQAYNNAKVIRERHRHRYEANPKYRKLFEEHEMLISGECNGLIEAIELANHPFFIGVQFHPEFTSRLQNPNAIILDFVKKSQIHKKQDYL